MLQPERMDKTIRKYASVADLDEIKARPITWACRSRVRTKRITTGTKF